MKVPEISNTTDALNRLDDDERSKFNLGRQGDTWCVNEPGLYSLVFSSKLPRFIQKNLKNFPLGGGAVLNTGPFHHRPQRIVIEFGALKKHDKLNLLSNEDKTNSVTVT